MALQFVPPSAAVSLHYQQSLLDFMGPQPAEKQLYHLPVGALGLPELAAGARLDDVVASGCRILASWPDGTWTSCEMTDPTLHSSAEFRNFTTGQSVGDAFARIAEATALSAVKNDDYELHFLTIPGIYFEALHLVRLGNAGDLILPLISIDPRLAIDAVYDTASFLTIAHAVAAARVAVTNPDPLSS